MGLFVSDGKLVNFEESFSREVLVFGVKLVNVVEVSGKALSRALTHLYVVDGKDEGVVRIGRRKDEGDVGLFKSGG